MGTKRLIAGMMGIIVMVGGNSAKSGAQFAPGAFADANNPSGPPDPTKLDLVWQVDPISGALSVSIPFPTVPAGGRGPGVPFRLLYNSASTVTLQSYGAAVSPVGTGNGEYEVECQIVGNGGCALTEVLGGSGSPGLSGGGQSIIQRFEWTSVPSPSSSAPAGPWTTSGPYLSNSYSSIPDQDFQMQGQKWSDGTGCQINGPYIYTDESGTTHDLNLKLTFGTNGGPLLQTATALCSNYPTQTTSTTSDGSALLTSVGSNSPIGVATVAGYPPLVIYPEGTQYNGNILEDANGNQTSISVSGGDVRTGQTSTTSFVDSLGRTVFSTNIPIALPTMLTGSYWLKTTGVTDTAATYSVVVGTAPLGTFTMPHPTPDEITTNGAHCIPQVTCTTGFDVDQVNRTNGKFNQEGVQVITSVKLPDKTSYSFSYDPVYGTLSQITFPTGGSVGFVWGIRSNDGGYGMFVAHSSLVVTQVNLTSGTGATSTWNYTFNPYSPSSGLTSKVVAPDSSYSTYSGTSLYFTNFALYPTGSAPTWKVGMKVSVRPNPSFHQVCFVLDLMDERIRSGFIASSAQPG